MQEVLPAPAAKVPCEQGAHCEEAGALLKEPRAVGEEAAAQGRGAAAPSGQALPAGHAAQAVALPLALYPALQALQKGAAATMAWPALQQQALRLSPMPSVAKWPRSATSSALPVALSRAG